MRRILRKIAASEEDSIGDISTLSDPTIVANLIEKFKGLSISNFYRNFTVYSSPSNVHSTEALAVVVDPPR